MNYEKAHKELLAGKKIRRKEWEALMHLRIINERVIAFKGEHSYFYQNPSILLSEGWRVVDGDGKSLTFLEAIEELRAKKSITHDDLNQGFIFVDKDNLALCRPVEFDFMPTWSCLISVDWETMK